MRRNHLREGWGDKGRNTFGHGERDLLIFREERGKVAMTSSTLFAVRAHETDGPG